MCRDVAVDGHPAEAVSAVERALPVDEPGDLAALALDPVELAEELIPEGVAIELGRHEPVRRAIGERVAGLDPRPIVFREVQRHAEEARDHHGAERPGEQVARPIGVLPRTDLQLRAEPVPDLARRAGDRVAPVCRIAVPARAEAQAAMVAVPLGCEPELGAQEGLVAAGGAPRGGRAQRDVTDQPPHGPCSVPRRSPSDQATKGPGAQASSQQPIAQQIPRVYALSAMHGGGGTTICLF